MKAHFPLTYEGVTDDKAPRVEVNISDEISMKGAYLVNRNSKRIRKLEDLRRTDVEAPDGKVISFPKGMSEEEIRRTMGRG